MDGLVARGSPHHPDRGCCNRTLARTLQSIVDSGPRVFYEGYIADSIRGVVARQ